VAPPPTSSLARPTSPPGPPDVPLLALDGVTKAFGRRVALREVSLTLARRTCLLVLGPNGAGKTTLLRVAAGIARPTSGSFLVEGSPREAAARLRPRVGYLAHQTLLYEGLTARQNLAFFARLYGIPEAEARAAELLALVGIERHADRAVGSLSRGLQQRLALARALVHGPAFLILDEPATGLDADGRRLLRETLLGLKSEGATILLAAHLTDAEPGLADRVAVLVEGELRHAGPAAGLAASDLVDLYDRAAGAA
jgi:ABC-type multidrug transport system ATPase subunit